MNKRIKLSFAASLLAVSSASFAHHSFASFDMGKTITLQGTVHAFEWSNPHSWLWIDVPDGQGGTVTWGLEGSAPGELSREGWNKHSVAVGDKLTVAIHPLKNGQKGGSFGKITFADGHSLGGNAVPGGGLPGEAPPTASGPPST